jgi:hypothetical protein
MASEEEAGDDLMGYPMTWGRLLSRNALLGNYTRIRGYGYVLPTTEQTARLLTLAGDLRRLEQDSVDGKYATESIAHRAGVDVETVVRVLKAFFDEAPALPPHDPVEMKP